MCVVVLLFTALDPRPAANGATAAVLPFQAAAQVDQLLSAESLRDQSLAPHVGDSLYLRRISLDILGELPTPEEIEDFCRDQATDKRLQAVRRMLVDPRYGQNWARYWRDVILTRRSNERALELSGKSSVDFLTAEINLGRGWDEIARSIITARGSARSDGRTILSVAHEAKPEETAAETARIFLGIQLQCAQCHDHPYDAWKRDQFHQLAAYFPRVVLRRIPTTMPADFEVASLDKPRGRGGNKAQAEHYMSNLNEPQSPGTLIHPRFFLGGEEEQQGLPDRERRAALAAQITENPWFAKALVNRVWGELLGRGFHEPIDDLGADRPFASPQTLHFLSQQFVANGYDLRWLIETITATAAYGRPSRPRSESEQAPFRYVVIQPLRADVLFHSLEGALQVDLDMPPKKQRGNAVLPRSQFENVFGYDPSMPREEVSASISQALWLMNSPRVHRAMRADSETSPWGKMLAAERNDDRALTKLYLRTVSREPTRAELAVARSHIGKTKNRTAAVEDVLWALINSAEFRERR